MSPSAAEMYTITPMMLLKPTGEICQHRFFRAFQMGWLFLRKKFADTNELYRQILCNLAIKHLCTVKDCCSTCQYKKVTVGRQITRKIWWLFCYGVQFHLSPLRDSPFTHHFIRIRMSGWHRIKVVVYIYTPHTNPISSKCKGLILGEWLSFSLDFFHTNF